MKATTPRTHRAARRHHRRPESLRNPDASTSPSDLVMRPFLGERGFLHR